MKTAKYSICILLFISSFTFSNSNEQEPIYYGELLGGLEDYYPNRFSVQASERGFTSSYMSYRTIITEPQNKSFTDLIFKLSTMGINHFKQEARRNAKKLKSQYYAVGNIEISNSRSPNGDGVIIEIWADVILFNDKK